MPDALRRRAEAIAKPTAQDLLSLRAAWRTERATEDRAAGIKAIGTAEWHQQYIDTPTDDPPTPGAETGSPVLTAPLADAVAVSS